MPKYLIILFLNIFTLLCSFAVFAQDAKENDTVKITADKVSYEDGYTKAEGNAIVLYKGAIVKADKITYVYSNKTLLVDGNIEISEKNSILYAEKGSYNLESEDAQLTNAKGTLSDIEQNGKKTDSKIYFWGETITKNSESIKINNGIFTTCDHPRPELHYHISCETAEIIPNDKIIAKKNRLKIKDKTLFTYNRLQFSLKEGRKQQQLFPTIGNNSNDGWFLKKEFLFELLGHTGEGRLDLFQKTGIAGGIDYPYSFDNGKGWGRLTWYNLSPSSNALVRETLTNDMVVRTIGKKEFLNSTHYNFTKNFYAGFSLGSYNYTYPDLGSSKWNSDNFYFGQSDKNQTYHYTQNTTYYNSYSYNTKKFDYSHRISDNLIFHTGGYTAGYAGNSPSNNSVWRYYADLDYSNDYLSAMLAYKRTTNDFAYYLDKMPEINISTKKLEFLNLPMKAVVSAGQYAENPTGLNMARGSLYLGIEPSFYDIGDSGKFNIAGGVKQTFCDDGSGQYIISGETGLYQKLNSFSAIKANYYYQKPHGYSPFIDDFTPTYSMLNAGVEISGSDKWKLSVMGGYDYHYDTKMSMIGILEMKPSDRFDWTLATNYNIDNHNMPSVTSQINWDMGNGVKLEHWSLYDTINNRFTYQDIGLSKETHDFFGKLVYRSQQKELWLQFYLKAFPDQPAYINPTPERSIVKHRGL